MNKNLTVGDPGKVLLSFTLPLFGSMIFQQLYNIADSIIAGKFAGEDALAAIGASYPITMIFMAIAVGCQLGCSVVIGKHFGANRINDAKTCISTSLISGFILSFVLTLLGVVFSPLMLKLLSTPENILSDGILYLRIYNGGFIFLFLYNVATGIFNSLGDSKTPLFLLICSSVSNIILDLVFVTVIPWGIAGVAWATFIAQGAACILALALLFRRMKSMKTEKNPPLFKLSALKEVLTVAIPSVLQQSFVSVGNLFIQTLVNSFGSSVIAGYSAAIKLNTFAILSFSTLGNGISSFTAQNMGSGQIERIKKGFRAGAILALCVAAVFSVAYFFLGRPFLELFSNEETTEKAIVTGITFLKIAAPFYPIICMKLVSEGVLRGSSCMKQFMFSTFTDLLLRVVTAYILAPFFDETGIWMAWPMSWTVAAVMSMYYYLRGVWIPKNNKN